MMTPEEKEAAAAKKKSQGLKVNFEDSDDIMKNIKYEAISNLVEHPSQIRPSAQTFQKNYQHNDNSVKLESNFQMKVQNLYTCQSF